MEPCTVESGLLIKKPCGQAAVTACSSCERPLCAKHAVPQLTASGARSGKFLCQECADANREHDKSMAALGRVEPRKPAGPAPQPPKKPAAQPAEQPPAAPAETKKPENDDGSIEFTPEKKP